MHVHSRVFCGLCVKARGQLADVSSRLPSRRSQGLISAHQARHSYLLSHLADPQWQFLRVIIMICRSLKRILIF